MPQRTRLIGRHEGEALHGQQRAFPERRKPSAHRGAGRCSAGGRRRAGSDHRLPLGVASLFGGEISTLGEPAWGGSSSETRFWLGSAGDAPSIEAAQVGGRLVNRELQVRPSIRVAPSAPICALITRDLILEPYLP